MAGDPIDKAEQARRSAIHDERRAARTPWNRRRGKRLSPMSDRPGAAEHRDAVWAAGQEAMRLARYRCQVAGIIPHDCNVSEGTDPQHLAPRNVRPDLEDDVDNIICVCRKGHMAIEADPILARQRGAHRHSGDPVVTPRPYLIDPDGNPVRPEDFR